jgi:plastocyanin
MAGLLAVPGAAAAATEVKAEGNPVTGGLGYSPSSLLVPVGERVNWRNTDSFAPHTATEIHGLWDLSGDYGATPFNPSGFGPGDTAGRTFEAGTHRYYCRVHGADAQSGTVAVAPRVAIQGVRVKVKRKARKRKARKRKARKKRRAKRKGRARRKKPKSRRRRRAKRHKRRRARTKLVPYVVTTWTNAPPASGLGFDVQYRRAGAAWQTLRSGTRERSGRFPAGRSGTRWQVRVRLRSAGDAAKATDWSPVASIG